MINLNLLKFKIGKKEYEIKYFTMSSTKEPWFLVDDIFKAVKYENDKGSANKDRLINLASKEKGFTYIKDLTNWIKEDGELVVNIETSNELTPFITWGNIFNLCKSDKIESCVDLLRLRRLEEFIVNIFIDDIKKARKGLKVEIFNNKVEKIKKEIDEMLKLKTEIERMDDDE